MTSVNDNNLLNDQLVIGITMGDPAGIGPEVIVKALADPLVRREAKFIIFGMNEQLTYAADRAEIYESDDPIPEINRVPPGAKHRSRFAYGEDRITRDRHSAKYGAESSDLSIDGDIPSTAKEACSNAACVREDVRIGIDEQVFVEIAR